MIFRRRSDPVADPVRRLAERLDVPRPWDRTQFLGGAAAAMGKRIRLRPLPAAYTASLPCGLVIERAEDVIIAYDATSSAHHADHIILHEVGHLLLGHLTDPDHPSSNRPATLGTTLPQTLASLFPGIDPATVRQVLHRGAYDTTAERQAELFASLIMSRVDTAPGSPLRRVLFG